jgi:hypothetical protein
VDHSRKILGPVLGVSLSLSIAAPTRPLLCMYNYRGFGVEAGPDLQVRAEPVLQPEDGRWVFNLEELKYLAESLNSVLQNSNPGAGWPFRLTLKQYIGLFTPPRSVSAGAL